MFAFPHMKESRIQSNNICVKYIRNLIFTFACLFLTTTLAIVYPKIQSLFSILGGFCAVTVCFLIPGNIYIYIYIYIALAYLLATPGPMHQFNKLATIILSVIVCLLGFGSAIRTVVNTIRGDAN